jgi:prepilin-type N-terminal cleavage/methylation domain-containing protein
MTARPTTRGPTRDRRRRPAFTLTEVIAAVAVVAVLAAIAIPTVKSRLSVGRGQSLVREIQSLMSGLQGFYSDTGTYPLYLDELVSVSTQTNTYCGDLAAPIFLTAGQTARWKGPYVSRVFTADYLTADGYTVVDLMARTTAGTPRFLQISINNVPIDVATVAEEVIDGPGAAFGSGNFKWTAGADPAMGNVTFQIVVPSTCV